jgi:hypothetical protein
VRKKGGGVVVERFKRNRRFARLPKTASALEFRPALERLIRCLGKALAIIYLAYTTLLFFQLMTHHD